MKILKSSILGCAVALALLGTASTSQATVSDKSILVGVDGAFAPFTYIDDSGKLIGFDVDIINAIGKTLDKASTEVMIDNMMTRGVIDLSTAKLISAATGERAYLSVPQQYRDSLRATIFKNMLLTLLDT